MNTDTRSVWMESEPKKAQIPPNVYENSHVLFAALSFIVGFLYVRFVFMGRGISVTIFTAIFLIFVLSYFHAQKKIFTKYSMIVASVIELFSLYFIIFPYQTEKEIILLLIQVACAYLIFLLGSDGKIKLDEMLPFDLLKSIIVMPFSSFGSAVAALFHPFQKKSFKNNLILVVGGLFLSIPVFSIITVLLTNADSGFSTMLQTITTFTENIFNWNNIMNLLLIPVALYLFGALYSSSENKCVGTLSREACENTKTAVKIIPQTLLCSAFTPLLALYVLFFISQGSYFLSAFSNVKPDNISYAQYARHGFFELCAVAIINFLIILFSDIFVKQPERKRPRFITGYIITLSIFTLVLIATSMSKMYLYIRIYGLTVKRMYPSVFMLFLATVFLFILLNCFVKKFNFIKSTAVIFVVLFFLSTFGNFNEICAKYNIAMYQNGDLQSIDFTPFYDTPGAVKYVLPLAYSKDAEIAKEANSFLQTMGAQLNTPLTWKDFNFVSQNAKHFFQVNTMRQIEKKLLRNMQISL